MRRRIIYLVTQALHPSCGIVHQVQFARVLCPGHPLTRLPGVTHLVGISVKVSAPDVLWLAFFPRAFGVSCHASLI